MIKYNLMIDHMEGEKYNLQKTQGEEEITKSAENKKFNLRYLVIDLQNHIENHSIENFFNTLNRHKEEYGITMGELGNDKDFQEYAKNILLRVIIKRYAVYRDFERVKLALEVSDEIYSSQEFKDNVITNFPIPRTYSGPQNKDDILALAKWLKKFHIPHEELANNPEFQNKAKQSLMYFVRDMDYFKVVKSIFGIPDEIYESKEFRTAGKGALKEKLENPSDHNLEKIKEYIEFYRISKEHFNDLVYAVITNRDFALDPLGKIDQFRLLDLPSDFFSKPEILAKITRYLALELAGENIEKVYEYIIKFNLPDRIFQDVDVLTSSFFSKTSHNLIKYIKYLNHAEFLQKFPKTTKKVKDAILDKLNSDLDLADYFLENLGDYYHQPWASQGITAAITHYSVAQKFIHSTQNDQTIWKNEPWVAGILVQTKTIIHPHNDELEDKEQKNKGFSDVDPYENHPWRFNRSQILISEDIKKILMGENLQELLASRYTEQKQKEYRIGRIAKATKKQLVEWQQDVDESEISDPWMTQKEVKFTLTPELQDALELIREKIDNAHKNFLQELANNPAIPNEDRIALVDPSRSSVKMNNLLLNVRAFVARYITQLCEGKIETIRTSILSAAQNIEQILQEGYRRYQKIYEVDIPLYDKLYEEFDHWREAGRYPLEVYLGRDGIYAYVGRRAQDATRRSKLGLEGRKKLEERGEVFEINPKYLVYPRYFRDNLSYDTKRQFLEQEGISPDADPLFYDTGYTGTIPEQIMRVMDFDTDDIETRIRLLSAPTAARRVKGIPENARSEIIEYIEHNAKTENTAEGLIVDPKTGQIRHIARPTEPEEQFYYMMIKQAIARHYLVKERIHYEPFRAVNFDSEHYGIRIVQEYAKKLPAEFMANPKQYFDTHGTLLKGSKGEGEFPDEEVILFTLDDGTEVVAKRIELRKAKEAKKEFMVLIAAKKAGLSTAEPVGFLSGKEEADGSYLLMEKLEGVSGRNFDKYLEKLGKFTEAQIQVIMKTITQKLEEQAKLYREKLNIDKRWRVKDTMIQFNEETDEIENVIPIDWERTKTYDPDKPQKIDATE